MEPLGCELSSPSPGISDGMKGGVMSLEGQADVSSLRAWRALAIPTPNPERFSGPVFMHDLLKSSDSSELEVVAVFFDPGARTVPHWHTTGQLLCFLDGEGIVGTHQERRLFRTGGMAYIPSERWHWHGATPTSGASHLSIRPGGSSAWPPDVEMDDWDTYMNGTRD
jgi:quercetin dioxygenase-like cupin family protein